MPIQIDVFDFKCFNQLRNGEAFDRNLSEFTPNLVGNIGETVKVQYTVNIAQSANTEGVEEWEFVLDVNEIRRPSGSFLDDGIQVGDEYLLYPDWAGRKTPGEVADYVGLVEFISSDGQTLRYSVVSGSPTVSGLQTNVGLSFDQAQSPNINTALFLKFGLISNEETFNFISKTTEAQQIYYVGGLSVGNTDPMESLGSIKDWVSGQATVEYVGIASPGFRQAQYIITHIFVLNPFYILSYREFIENGTIPDLLVGDSSIKYAAELEFRKTLTNIGSSKAQDFDSLGGFVGWYGENFNGLNADYRIVSVSYEEDVTGDPLDAVNINTATKATIVVENINGAITDYSCAAYVFRVPDSEDDYIGTTTDLLENFLFKSGIVSSPDTTSTNITTSLVSGNLVIEYTIDYTTAQKLQLTTDDEFILLVQVEDPTISAGNSDRMMLLAAFENYVDIDFLADFVNVPTYQFLQHDQDIGDTGSFLQELSNEDGILLDAIIGINTVREVIVNAISINLIAYNASENKSFELDTYDFNIGDLVIAGGVQQIEVDTTRGYPLPPNDIFNLVQITTESQVGDYQQYGIRLGQKIKWQDWIFNPRVDSVFFDALQPNNNLNEKSSNYSGEQNYEIKLALVVNVTGKDDLGRTLTGDFINYGLNLGVSDYGESTDGVSGTIQTFDLETGNSLEGNILYNGKDTLFKAVFENAGAMQYGIHRIEPSQNQGDGILELSSIRPSVAGNLLKPLAGETQLKFDLVGSDLTTECLIDGSLIQEGISYKLSARVSREPLVLENPFTFTIDTSNAGDSASDQFQLPLLGSGVYDIIVDKGNGDPLVSITSFDAPETLLDYSVTGAGQYEVKLYGVIRGWSFSNTTNNQDPLKILDISTWGTFQPTLVSNFTGASNLDISATEVIDLSQTTSLASFFSGCSSLTYNSSISSWDVSGITNLDSTFQGASSFNQPLNSWNIGNVTIMAGTFRNASSFNQPLNSWNVSAVLNMQQMFFGASSFNGNITGWTTSSVTNMLGMFQSASSFNQNIGTWNVTSVTTMRDMFQSASSFNQNIGTWTTTALTDIVAMFRSATSFNQNINSWNVSGITSLVQTFFGCTAFNQPLDSWDVSGVTSLKECFNSCLAFNQNLNSWVTSSVINTNSTFEGCSAFDGNITSWDMSSVTNMTEMFSAAISFNQDISGWTTSSLQLTTRMFRNNTSTFDRNLGSWDVSNLTDATDMFLNSALSTANYDALLIGWEGQAVQNNVTLNAGSSNYTAAGAAGTARAALLADHSWIISDGGGV